MLKSVVVYVTASVIGVACLSLLTLIMIRDKMKDIDVGPYDE
tara:strand:+ start:345 stop:470 length:126 start_codon:yes stop_codon:yes gene_type:complete